MKTIWTILFIALAYGNLWQYDRRKYEEQTHNKAVYQAAKQAFANGIKLAYILRNNPSLTKADIDIAIAQYPAMDHILKGVLR